MMRLCCFLLFFFFKQKTAYEMRISDWSSDVCSSDLRIVIARGNAFDVVAPVIGLDRALRTKHDARRHGRFATGMTDVVALQPLRRLVQVKNVSQEIGRAACRERVCQYV